MTERPLVEAFLAGEEQAFDTLYDRHTPALYQFAMRLVGGGTQDAEDVVQETWLRAADRLGGFTWRSTFRTWLMGIVVNCARELVRRRARDAEPPTASRNRTVTVQPFRPESIDLERAIATLPAEFRFVLVLHDLVGFTHAEIAVRLDIAWSPLAQNE